MGNKKEICVHWFRRDLRLDDNAALYHALRSGYKVLPLFIFDKSILGKLEEKEDKRVLFIHRTLLSLQGSLRSLGSTLDVRYCYPEDVWEKLCREYNIRKVFTNHDYEPYARERDTRIAAMLQAKHIEFHTFKDQVIFDRDEILKDDGKPYTVYTPYSRKWMAKLNDFYLSSYPSGNYLHHFLQQAEKDIPAMQDIGFKECHFHFPSGHISDYTLLHYAGNRDIPGIEGGTSKISIHLRFGTLSIRTLARRAKDNSHAWLNELCWREFYKMILWHFPHAATGAFKPAYDHIQWRNDPQEFDAWCNGKTGYPIVDAGMHELNQTGFMHNRVRMIVASFLVKHLLIDWRWGEAYFAKKLLDFDMSANNGGWQWAAGSGCDAAPYFRIFNPWEQTRKFDPDSIYIRKWVPGFEDFSYPKPIVEHRLARERCLRVFKQSLAVI